MPYSYKIADAFKTFIMTSDVAACALDPQKGDAIRRFVKASLAVAAVIALSEIKIDQAAAEPPTYDLSVMAADGRVWRETFRFAESHDHSYDAAEFWTHDEVGQLQGLGEAARILLEAFLPSDVKLTWP